MLFRFLIIVHLIVDFYTQTDEKVELKESQKLDIKNIYKNELLKHTILYMLLSTIIFFAYSANRFIDYFAIVMLFLSHGIIDLLKIYLKKKFIKIGVILFWIDQVIHIAILIFVVKFIELNFFASFELDFDLIYLDYTIALLLISKTANVIFAILFGRFKPVDSNNDEPSIQNGHKNAGALIGTMERILIMICLLSGNFATIGFVIAAKSVARFEKLSKTQFGEYFLLGTLYSVLFTMLVYYALFVI